MMYFNYLLTFYIMKTTITLSAFRDSFSNRRDNFSYKGLKTLFDYLEEVEASTGEELKLDPIALCCEYTEYKDIEELKQNYTNIKDLEELEENTFVLMIDDESFIIQDF